MAAEVDDVGLVAQEQFLHVAVAHGPGGAQVEAVAKFRLAEFLVNGAQFLVQLQLRGIHRIGGEEQDGQFVLVGHSRLLG